MRLHCSLTLAVFCTFLTCLAPAAMAQFPMTMSMSGGVPASVPVISVTGASTLKPQPDTIRVIVSIQGQGKTAEEALQRLETEKKSASEKAGKLGFEAERLKFGNLTLDQMQESKRRQMEMMIAQRMSSPGKARPQIPESVTLKLEMTVEQPLNGRKTEEILKEVQLLKNKFKTADFSPKPVGLTPEEEELAEEIESMMEDYYDEPTPGNEPLFLYVAKVAENEAKAAYRDAFEQARKQGDLLAEIAGVKRGTLLHLSSNFIKNQASYSPYMSRNEDYYMLQMLNAESSEETKQYECLLASPDNATFIFSVQAQFRIEEGKE